MDAHLGYNQVLMHQEYGEKTSFKTTFCFRIMSFGMWNVLVTFQRLMDKIFKEKIGRNVEGGAHGQHIHLIVQDK